MAFDPQSEKRIARIVKRFERQNLNDQPRMKLWGSRGGRSLALVQCPNPAGIAARPAAFGRSTGDCDVLAWDDTAGEYIATGETIEVSNWSSAAVLADGLRLGVVGRSGSEWLVISEDCSDGSTFEEPGTGEEPGGGDPPGGGGGVGA